MSIDGFTPQHFHGYTSQIMTSQNRITATGAKWQISQNIIFFFPHGIIWP
jgi:hypothetical protein